MIVKILEVVVYILIGIFIIMSISAANSKKLQNSHLFMMLTLGDIILVAIIGGLGAAWVH